MLRKTRHALTSLGTMAKMRLFTQEEANAALPEVRALAERLVDERHALVALGEELEAMQALIGGNGGSLDPSRVGELQEAVARAAAGVAGLVDEIHELGVQVKDLDRGLVDFPARHPGERRHGAPLLGARRARGRPLARPRDGIRRQEAAPLLENSVVMDTEWIERLAVAGVVLLATLIVAPGSPTG